MLDSAVRGCRPAFNLFASSRVTEQPTKNIHVQPAHFYYNRYNALFEGRGGRIHGNFAFGHVCFQTLVAEKWCGMVFDVCFLC